MKIEWNKVTWYSKILALILFIALPIFAFCLGMKYERALEAANGVYPKGIKSGENF